MVVTQLSSLARRWPVLHRLHLPGIIRRLPALGFDPMGIRPIGPLSIGLDVRDFFQWQMLVDTYELATTATMREVLRPGDTYVDIGTQLGFTAAIAAQAIGPTGRLILVEPDPVALARLESHLKAAEGHPMLPRVNLVRAACSNKPGKLQFHISPTLGHSRILRPGEEIQTGRIIEVPVRTADDILAELDVTSVRFLKIDAEGHELSVLNGLQKTLGAGRVEVIHIEKNQHLFDEPVADTRALHALIAQHGLAALHEELNLWLTEETLSSEDYPLENLLFLQRRDILPPELLPPGKPAVFDKEYLRQWAARGQELDTEARRIVRQARAGDLAGGISKAEDYLALHPDDDSLRGHLAWWYKSSGNNESAMRHYQILAEHAPEDEAVKAQMRDLAKKNPG